MTKSAREHPSTPGSKAQTMEFNEQIVRANGVGLSGETFGDSAEPAILLIHGAATSMLGWEDEFCERLAAGSRFVIRYDNRDTGRSVSYEPGAPQYTLRDLTADAIGLHTWAVELPSCAAKPVPSVEAIGDMHTDAGAVHAALDEENEPVVLVVHSYGGMVITDAAAGHENVRHLV